MSTAEQIMGEIQNLPEPFAREVLDFIEYIEVRLEFKACTPEEFMATPTPATEHA